MMKKLTKIKLPKNFSKVAFLLLSVATLNLAAFAPLLQSSTQAAPGPQTYINVPLRSTHQRDSGTQMANQTCYAYFTKEYLSQGLINAHLPFSGVGTGGGGSIDPDAGDTYGEKIDFAEEYLGRNVSVVRFAPASGSVTPINGVDSDSAGAAACNNLMLIPTGPGRWTGAMFSVENKDIVDVPVPVLMQMVFTNNDLNNPNRDDANDFSSVGISYYDVSGSCSRINDTNFPDETFQSYQNGPNDNCLKTRSDFRAKGRPTNIEESTTASTNLSLTARWIDASTIERDVTIPGTSGSLSGKETYKLNRWREFKSFNNSLNPAREVSYTVYFLQDSEEAARNSINEASGRSCANPIGELDSLKHPGFDCTPPAGGQQCTPFIVVTEQLNISNHEGQPNIDSGSGESFADRVVALGNANVYFYDFNAADCSYRGHSAGGTIGDKERAKAWFYYSEQNKAVRGVFPEADGHEAPYIGAYEEITRSDDGINPNVTFRGGEAGCSGQAIVNGTTPLRSTNWRFWHNPNCSALSSEGLGSVTVLTIAGQEGEDGFNELSNYVPPLDVEESGELQELSCVSNFALDWIACPILNATIAATEGFDSVINNLLNIDTNQLFSVGGTSDDYHEAWGVFRTFALVLIAAAALIMVIGQAAGLEIMDAYTIRKVLPRLIIATIGITLSWEILEFLVTLSNDLGSGIRSIIYAPFDEIDNRVNVALVGIIPSLVTVGGVLVLGLSLFPLVLSLLLTAAIAGLVATLALVFREIVVIFLVITAPIAIACGILPNTEKVWTLWRNTLAGMLVAYVLISGVFAISKVFAVTSAGGGVLGDIIAVLAWILPYLLFFQILLWSIQLASVVARLVGGAVDSSRGVLGGLKKQRSGILSRRGEQLKTSSEGNAVARGFGGLMRRATPGSGGFVPTARGQASFQSAQQAMLQQAADDAIKKDNGRAAGDDLGNDIASRGVGGKEFRTQYAQRLLKSGDFRKQHGVQAEQVANQQARQAQGALEAGYGANMGSKLMSTASLKASYASNTSFAKKDDGTAMEFGESLTAGMQPLVEAVARGDMSIADATAIYRQNAGRYDRTGAGFGKTMGTIETATQRYQQGQRGQLLNDKEITDFKKAAWSGADARAIAGGRHEAASLVGSAVVDQAAEARENDNAVQFGGSLASLIKMQDSAGQAHDVMAEKLAANLRLKPGAFKGLTARQMVDKLRSGEMLQTATKAAQDAGRDVNTDRDVLFAKDAYNAFIDKHREYSTIGDIASRRPDLGDEPKL